MSRFLAPLFFATLSLLQAQDPGVREYPEQRSSASAQANAAAAAASANPQVSKSAAVLNSMDVLDDTQMIEAGDLISLRIVEDQDPRQPLQLRVGATGQINAPHIGLVLAAGRTCKALAMDIKRRLEANYYNTATVIVAIDLKGEDNPAERLRVSGYDIALFTVFGQVLRQGQHELPYNEDITISQAILRAGGFAQFADTKRVKLVRPTPQGHKTILVNLHDIMQRGRMEHDLYLRENDVIIVDEKKVNF
jgi:protein involved in polysaccharide export with SLBB domain